MTVGKRSEIGGPLHVGKVLGVVLKDVEGI